MIVTCFLLNTGVVAAQQIEKYAGVEWVFGNGTRLTSMKVIPGYLILRWLRNGLDTTD